MKTGAATKLAVAFALALGCAGETRLNGGGQKKIPQGDSVEDDEVVFAADTEEIAAVSAANTRDKKAVTPDNEVVTPENVERVPPKYVRRRILGGGALLVYAYDNDENFKLSKLQGAIPFSEFKQMLPMLPLDKEIYFYCG